MTSIAYFGIKGSYTEDAARTYAQKQQLLRPRYISCKTVEDVFRTAAERRCIGIVPYHNANGGYVDDYRLYVPEQPFEEIDTVKLTIRHCLLSLRPAAPSHPKAIVSHRQALVQCEPYLIRHYPAVPRFDYANTAIAARDLAKGILPEDWLVVASERAADAYGLHVVARDMGSGETNITTFKVVGPIDA